jgi:hypothetical protein
MNLKNAIGLPVFIIVLSFIFGCAVQTKLADYQPKTADEKAVLDCMTKMNEAMATEDVSKTMAVHHDNAQIRIPQGTSKARTMVSKQQFKTYLEGGGFKEMRLNVMEELKVREPVIVVTGDRAIIKGTSPATNVTIQHQWDLVKEEDKWLIIKVDWWW